MQALRVVIALVALSVVACAPKEPAREAPPPASEPAAAAAPESTNPTEATDASTGTAMTLKSIDLQPGTGPAIKAGQYALVHYTGWLFDAAATDNKGKQFDSSVGGEPFDFPVGGKHVIKGWDEGVAGMQVGGKRRLVIPPEMGYGASGAGGVIPPNATLVFDIELLEIR
jgi:FKBP-type peptidyl-prolyl cis-trans isomerase FkpA